MLIAAGRHGVLIVENGKVTKQFKTRNACQDACIFKNGDIVVTEGIGYTKFDKDGQTLMQYTVEKGKKREVHSCQLLGKDSILIAESGPSRLLELDKDGNIKKE